MPSPHAKQLIKGKKASWTNARNQTSDRRAPLEGMQKRREANRVVEVGSTSERFFQRQPSNAEMDVNPNWKNGNEVEKLE